MSTTEATARINIDDALARTGWAVQDIDAVNLYASRGVAVREFPLPGYGAADYLLFADGQAVGAVEAKKEGATLTGVEIQSARYGAGLPAAFDAPVRPLPFLYETTGLETRFTNRLDPEPRSRRVFAFHRPETLAAWVAITPTAIHPPTPITRTVAEDRPRYDPHPTLRGRLRSLPPVHETGLWPAQLRAVQNLERSFRDDRPRALIQMATGSGKTFTAITSIYRLIKFAGATRVLFLVDRANLGRQALKEFQHYTTPDDGRKFTELYNVQHLRSNRIDPVARVVITTIQRLYSILQGEPDLDPTLEEGSLFDSAAGLIRDPVPVTYNQIVPPETFDVVFTDECHRSIYGLWRQVLEYFDASLVGLTATPSKQTIGFFNKNLVMEYGHQQAVADGVNVDFDVYQIRTRITAAGATVEADYWVDRRDRATRARRIEQLDEELTYAASDLDRAVVAEDQIRTVVRTFKEKLFTEIFPGRTEVPKTLIFAKDDSHADDIVQIVREEFGRGNQFAQKITYRTTGASPEQLIADFRNSYYPRVVVTVDMVATGTDIKPLEIVMFMRSVKSPNFFEQMKGRGVRVIPDTDFQQVVPDAKTKTHFVLVDCVGVTDHEFNDTHTLERTRSVAFAKLLNAVAYRADPDLLSSLAGRLARLDRQLDPTARAALTETAGGLTLGNIVAGIVDALDPDRQLAAARAAANLPADAEPPPDLLAQTTKRLLREAAKPLAANPALRTMLLDTKRRTEQTIDTVSLDEVLTAGFSQDARDRAGAMVASFEAFIEHHKDEITALQILYARPYAHRLRFADIKTLALAIQTPPRAWTPDTLWRAYETLDQSKARGSAGTQLTNIVALVRYALHQDDHLIPYPDQVAARFQSWLAQQEATGRHFTPDQRQWLHLIRDHIAGSLRIDPTDFEYAPFSQRGGLGKIYEVFGDELDGLLEELNEVLAA